VQGRMLWAAALLAPVAVHAQTGADPISGKAALGYLATRGNADNTSANASFELDYNRGGIWHYLTNANAVGATSSDATTAEAYWAGIKAQRDFSETNYLFGALDWKKDRFSGYRDQLAEVLGFGRHLITNERHVLSAEGGAGARQATLATGESQDETILRGSLDYLFTISETSSYSQTAMFDVGNDNTFSEFVSKLSSQIVGDASLVLSYTIRSNSDVPVGTEKRDTFTAIALEYAF
jgi:putative salt-induced outer membrane protein